MAKALKVSQGNLESDHCEICSGAAKGAAHGTASQTSEATLPTTLRLAGAPVRNGELRLGLCNPSPQQLDDCAQIQSTAG
jgi:hypothetical protein